MKPFVKDQLAVFPFETREELGRRAAADVAARIRTLLAEKPVIRMIFAAAPSQDEFLAALTADPTVDFSRIDAFHMDEYIGLAADAPQGFGNFLRDRLFSKVPFRSVNYLNGQAPDPEAECRRYGELLAEGVDIVCMGIGENGHIAFNDPAFADFQDEKPVKVVELDPVCRMQQVHDGCFSSLDQVPTHALTLTIPTLTQKGTIFCMVPARTKAQAVKACLEGPVAESCPASILRKRPGARLYLDADSASLLEMKGVSEMIRIGIIGTENSHAMAFARALNLPDEKGGMRFPGVRVAGVYGPDLESAQAIIDETGADFLADRPEDFFGKVDAMIVTCRKGSLHYRYAKPFLEAGIPMFIDKPFTVDMNEAKELVSIAREKGALLAGGSGCKFAYDVLMLQNTVKNWKAAGDFVTGTMNFAADPASEYDGFFFYSSHLTEMALTVFGYDPRSVLALERNGSRACILRYEDCDVTLNFTRGTCASTGTLIGRRGNVTRDIDISMIYLHEIGDFVEMLQTGKAGHTPEELIKPVAVINTIEQSVREGREVLID